MLLDEITGLFKYEDAYDATEELVDFAAET
jgi:hypothetical protein